MRRGPYGPRSASTAASLAIKQSGSMGRRAASTDENNLKGEAGAEFMEGATPRVARNGSGPLTDRVKRMEKKFGQVLELQAKFNIMDKWIQQQFGIKLFPKAVVNSEKFAEGDPDDVDNPFYAVYLVVQRMKALEDKVAKLESRPYEDAGEPTSHYSAAKAFKNTDKAKANATGGVKRAYGATSSPTTPKKQKVMPRPVAHSSNYPFKPSVKILPKTASPIKKEKTDPADSVKPKDATPTKTNEQTVLQIVEIKTEPEDKEPEQEVDTGPENAEIPTTDSEKDKDAKPVDDASKPAQDVADNEKTDTNETISEKETQVISVSQTEGEQSASSSKETEKSGDKEPAEDEVDSSTVAANAETQELTQEIKENENETQAANDDDTNVEKDEDLPILEAEDTTAAAMNEEMEVDSEQDEEEVEQKPLIPAEEEISGDISGSEASVSSFSSASGRPRLSTRRQAAAAAALSTGKGTEDEKPVMYTARGRRHTVPRRYAEFTGHDNVVSILKSQQRAEKTAGTPGRPGRKPGSSKLQPQDTPPKIKKMVKAGKAQATPKKPAAPQTDSDGDGELGSSPPSKKKAGPSALLSEKPECVDVLVDRVMAREVDDDGMVLLSEAYPNIYVNQQQLVNVVVRSNGKATRLTRKMTTLVFEDSLLASASPFGTKYYKDRLPPEPLEAMVDFIADSGFEPHYTKKKIYMIVGQVCNEARAGRVSKKFMQPLEAGPTAGPSGLQESQMEESSSPLPPPSPSAEAEESSPQ